MKTVNGIYVITDETLSPGRSHVDIARAAVVGGASVVQLRDKVASDEYMIRAGLEIRRLTADAGVLFIVNDRLEVALACDADGLHVGSNDRPAAELRPYLDGKVLGVSVATEEEAHQAARDGADSLGVGPIYPTGSKADAGSVVGTGHMETMRRASGGLHITAIGGITEENLPEVARAGADTIAVISAVVCADDMVEATRRLVAIWKAAKNL